MFPPERAAVGSKVPPRFRVATYLFHVGASPCDKRRVEVYLPTRHLVVILSQINIVEKMLSTSGEFEMLRD